MKIPFKQIDSFVKTPNSRARVILVYGPDSGLMRERARAMGLSVVSDYNDPFNVATLSTEILTQDPARLSDEANSISMMGGDRLVRVEGASDKLTALIKIYLKNPSANTLVMLEAGELGPRSSLRKLCEIADNAAALPCYVEDERDLSHLIRDVLGEAGLSAHSDAAAWLAVNIAGDRARARSELEKLIIYKGQDDPSPITLIEVQEACGEAGAQSFDDLVYSVAEAQSEKALRSYAKLIAEDVPFIVILRTLQNHFRRLHATKARIESGESPDQAMKRLIPPVFFKQQQAFGAQSRRWSLKNLGIVLERLAAIEAQCKTTDMPVETLCAQTILGIASIRR